MFIDSWIYTPSLSELDEVRRGFQGVDAVVHLAALVHQFKELPFDDYHRVNVLGTQSMVDLAVDSGVQRFIYVSTVKVNGESTSEGGAFDVESVPAPTGPYALSKLHAERIVTGRSVRREIETVILRPVLLYGPDVGGNFLRLLNLVKRGLPLPFGGIRNARSLLFIDNFCDLIRTCLIHHGVHGRTFFAADEHAISTPNLVREIAAALSKEARLYSVPPAVLRGIARVLGQRERLGRLVDSLEVSLAANEMYLAWKPTISTREGIRRTVAAMGLAKER